MQILRPFAPSCAVQKHFTSDGAGGCTPYTLGWGHGGTAAPATHPHHLGGEHEGCIVPSWHLPFALLGLVKCVCKLVSSCCAQGMDTPSSSLRPKEAVAQTEVRGTEGGHIAPSR